MASYVPKKWNNAVHRSPYRKNNSPGSVQIAADGSGALDCDFTRSKDGRWLWNHWNRLWIEKYRYTAASVAAGVPKRKVGKVCMRKASSLPWKIIKTLRTKDGYRIYDAGTALHLCATAKRSKGENKGQARPVRMEGEPKFTPSVAMLVRFRDRARAEYTAVGKDWKQMCQMKRLTTIAGWKLTLKRAKGRGFITFVLKSKGKGLPAYVDYYRK